MKTIAIAFFLLCASAAFGQTAGVLPNNPQPVVIPDHPQHAVQHSMASDDNLRGAGAYTFEHGERPLSDFVTDSGRSETPLGDIARMYRKEHAIDRKATIVMEK